MSIKFQIKFHPNNLQNPDEAKIDRMILTEIARIQIDAIDKDAKPGTAASKPPPREDVIKYLIEKGARQCYAEAKHLEEEKQRIKAENAKAKDINSNVSLDITGSILEALPPSKL